MRALSVILVVVLLCTGALGVQVMVGDRSFPLEAVKELKELMDLDEMNPQLTKDVVEDTCADPLLPQVFESVCADEVERKPVFYELVFQNIDQCETCSFDGCTGC
uniref:Guanylate cyclase activator 2B n=1 Tax=Acanthochromis polyacanthus TaxID=80966 RepID=A0A3Q1FKG7_9TELE